MEEDKNKEKLSSLEALLFIYGEPIAETKIQKTLGLKKAETEALIAAFKEELARPDRGLTRVVTSGNVQLVTKVQFNTLLESFAKEELGGELTPASLETLSIIAYLGPVNRAKIDYLRGVNSAFTVRNLLLRGLIERETNPDDSHSYLYAPSVELIRHLGLSNRESLPDYQKFQSLLKIGEEHNAG